MQANSSQISEEGAYLSSLLLEHDSDRSIDLLITRDIGQLEAALHNGTAA